MAHKTLIDGTAYEISGGRTLVNGTGYDIASGKTLVAGTAYEVGFVNTMTITLLGDFTSDSDTASSNDNNILYNGERYFSGDTIEANVGEKITFQSSYNQYSGEVYLNGTKVSGSGRYIYTVVSDATITVETYVTQDYNNGKFRDVYLFKAYIVDANA